IISGKLTLALSDVPMSAVMESSLQSSRRAAEAKAITLEAEIGADLGILTGDAARLEQIVQNAPRGRTLGFRGAHRLCGRARGDAGAHFRLRRLSHQTRGAAGPGQRDR